MEVGVCEFDDDGDVLFVFIDCVFWNWKGELVWGFEGLDVMFFVVMVYENRVLKVIMIMF